MIAERQKAVALTTTPKNELHKAHYRNLRAQSSGKRQERIAIRRAQIPRSYKATYDKAVQLPQNACEGRSVRPESKKSGKEETYAK